MVKLSNIHKSFGKNEVLKGIDINIKKGDVVSLMGPSGTGKTTLLRCINFLERPNEGEVMVDGFTVQSKHTSKKDIISLRKKTAMVFQNYNLFKNMTVIENVMEGLVYVQGFSKEEAEKRSLEELEKVGLIDKKDYYSFQLSGGQQQRVGIARAIALKPKVILFDEPTSALDPELVNEVLIAIKKVALSGITTIIVTHEVEFAKSISDKIVFMDDGKIIEEGTPREIFQSPKQERTKDFVDKVNKKFVYTI